MIPVHKNLMYIPIVFDGTQNNLEVYAKVTHVNVPFDCYFMGGWLTADTIAGAETILFKFTDGDAVEFSDVGTILDVDTPDFCGHLAADPETVRITAYTTDITLMVLNNAASGDYSGYIILQAFDGTENDVWEGPQIAIPT